MDLQGKKVLFLGDSITEGHGTSSAENGFVSVFEKMSGATAVNYGIGGTRIAKQTAKSADANHDRDFIERADEMESEADAVVVFGGTNDYGHGDALLGNFQSDDEYTFYGAMHSLCKKLINKYPKSNIVFMTPLHRLDESVLKFKEDAKNGVTLKVYVDIIKEIAGYYGLPVLDLFNTSGMQPNVDIIREMYMPDGLHPSDAGAKKLAERVYSFMKAL